ncbi:MAG: asparagine synthetase B, partial [Cyclobacteriaceae bacterium]|nr:asparagine synthetase B [Cyclobacteriaceae bacterium]
MCGIAGFVEHKNRSQNVVLEEMIGTLRHRGPDNLGYYFWQQDAYQIGLAHARLSIMDVTSAGHQPMTFESYTITLNGEIYNYAEIRTTLTALGHRFQSNSDTEVVLHAFAEWGTKCVDKFIGMFAF